VQGWGLCRLSRSFSFRENGRPKSNYPLMIGWATITFALVPINQLWVYVFYHTLTHYLLA